MNRLFLITYLISVFLLQKQTYGQAWSLNNFFDQDSRLSAKTDSLFNSLTPGDQVGQMITQAAGYLGKDVPALTKLISGHDLGGIIMLKGDRKTFKKLTYKFDSVSKAHKSLPLLFSADAEPSLINQKITGTKTVMPTSFLKSVKKCSYAANSIATDLKYLGIRQNFAPTCDLAGGNTAIGNRSFGHNADTVALLARTFIKTMHTNGIVATAKHFPGHGFVKGDTHKQSVYINGALKEVSVYRSLIDSGLIAVMVGHIAVRNNDLYDTQELPATCSPVIIKKLLREDLQFKGIVISDAMNMKAATLIPHAALKAAMAGCDMILMPLSVKETKEEILNEMLQNDSFKTQVSESVKKIIRLKICLGLL